jgi:hypothetical protein
VGVGEGTETLERTRKGVRGMVQSTQHAENSRGPVGGASTQDTNPTNSNSFTYKGSYQDRPPSPVTVMAPAPTPPTAGRSTLLYESRSKTLYMSRRPHSSPTLSNLRARVLLAKATAGSTKTRLTQ